MGAIVGEARTKKSAPFAFEDSHHACVKSWCIAGSKRHDAEAPFVAVGCEESKLFLIFGTNHDLMVSSLIVESDEKETASGVSEIVDSVVATRNRILERQGDLV